MKKKTGETATSSPETTEHPQDRRRNSKTSTQAPVFQDDLYKTLADSSQVGVYFLQDRSLCRCFAVLAPVLRMFGGFRA